ncbi:hypothetical protein LCGC14_2738180, partial [marine sediment metagenome]
IQTSATNPLTIAAMQVAGADNRGILTKEYIEESISTATKEGTEVNIVGKIQDSLNEDYFETKVGNVPVSTRIDTPLSINQQMDLYNSPGTQHYGIIYQIRNKFTNKIRIGRYKGSLVDRWSKYKRESRRGEKDHISNSIRKYERLGYDMDTSINNNDVYDFDILAVVPHGPNAEKLYYELEEYFVAHLTRQSNLLGYNILKGGKDEILSGPAHPGWIDISAEDLDQALWWSIEIPLSKAPVGKYLARYFGVGRKKIASMIGLYYKKIENGIEVPMTYKEVREQKIAIAMEKYWKLGYHGKEFAKFFGMDRLADISRKTTFNKWSHKFFDKRARDARNEFLDDAIIHLVKMGLTQNQIDESLPGIGLATIKSRLVKFGGIRGLRSDLYKSILQNLLGAQVDDVEIGDILFIPYEDVNRYTERLWGM